MYARVEYLTDKTMTIRIYKGDVLDARADSLLLTVDGERKGLQGNIACAFARRWPDAFEEIAAQIAYPLPLGRAVLIRAETDCPFQAVLFASTLHHLEVLSEAERARVTGMALQEAIGLARRHGMRSLASAVMAGGWRLPFDSALGVMLATAGHLTHSEVAFDLLICVRSEAEYASAVSIADGKGVCMMCRTDTQAAGNSPEPHGG